MEWTRILAYITGSVDRELLLRNEYLAAENRILRTKLNRRLQFSDAERATLGEIGFRLGRRTLSEVATAAQPDTILAWLWGAKWLSMGFVVDNRKVWPLCYDRH
jgi:hypothetical protein